MIPESWPARWAARPARTTPMSPAPAAHVASARAMPLPRACQSAAVRARRRASSSRAVIRSWRPKATSSGAERTVSTTWSASSARMVAPLPAADRPIRAPRIETAITPAVAASRMAPATGSSRAATAVPSRMLAPMSIVIVVLLARASVTSSVSATNPLSSEPAAREAAASGPVRAARRPSGTSGSTVSYSQRRSRESVSREMP